MSFWGFVLTFDFCASTIIFLCGPLSPIETARLSHFLNIVFLCVDFGEEGP